MVRVARVLRHGVTELGDVRTHVAAQDPSTFAVRIYYLHILVTLERVHDVGEVGPPSVAVVCFRMMQSELPLFGVPPGWSFVHRAHTAAPGRRVTFYIGREQLVFLRNAGA